MSRKVWLAVLPPRKVMESSQTIVTSVQANAPISFPLCFSQENLLAQETLRNQSGSFGRHHVLLGLTVRGALDRGRLDGVLQQLIHRQSALRSAFGPALHLPQVEWRAGMGVFSNTGMLAPGLFRQSIIRDVILNVQFERVRRCKPAEQAQALKSILSKVFSLPFNYRCPPPMRALLVQFEPDRHLLILVVHQLVCDSWSLRVIHEELLAAFVAGGSENRDAPPCLPFEFHDFARWQHRQASVGYFRPSLEYWREQWSKYEEGQLWYRDIPFAIRDQVRQAFPAEAQSIWLGDEMTKDICKRLGVSVPTLVLTALYAYLHGRTGKSKVAVWNVFANRSQRGTETLVGYFANLHLVGVEIAAGTTGSALLAHVAQQLENAERHAEVHTSLLWRMLGRIHRLGDVGLLFNSIDETDPRNSSVQSGGLTIERAILPHISGFRGNAGLHITIAKRGSGYALISHFSPGRFRSNSIRKLLRDIMSIAGRIAETPEDHISRLTVEYTA